MKTLNLSNSTKAENLVEIANEACNILNSDADENQDFQVDGEDIIEYDLTEEIDPIYWKIDTVAWNEDGTASQVNLDC